MRSGGDMLGTYKTHFFLSDEESFVPVKDFVEETQSPTTIDKCTAKPPGERQQLWNGLVLLGKINPEDEDEGHLAPSPLSLNAAKNFINLIPFFMPFPCHLMGGEDGNIIFRWKGAGFDWIATIAGSSINMAKRTPAGYELMISENMPIYSSALPDGIKAVLADMRGLMR